MTPAHVRLTKRNAKTDKGIMTVLRPTSGDDPKDTMPDYKAIPDAKYQTFEEQSDPSQVAPRLAGLRAELADAGIEGSS